LLVTLLALGVIRDFWKKMSDPRVSFTRNREDSTAVTFVLITHNRREELEECLNLILEQSHRHLEVFVVDNKSGDGTEALFAHGIGDSRVHYIPLDENRGDAARNVGIRRARGDFLIFIDDDALLADAQAVQKVLDRFGQDRQLGVLAFKSVNYYSGTIAREEFPHRDKSLDPDMEFETSYFIGVGHAVRREVFETVGLYPEDFLWGFWEMDFSFRVLDAGYRILYFPCVEVLHKKSPKGRRPGRSVWRNYLHNRISTSIRNLPWRYVILSSIVWLVYVLLRTRGDVFLVVKVIAGVLSSRRELLRQRKPIRSDTVRRLRQLKGRLLY
jgi:GT2 family glycosyltransferase